MLKKENITRSLIILAAIALIMLFFPRSDSRHFQFEMNRPWTHSLLTAPFDIPVFRDSLSVKQLRDSLNRAFSPIMQTQDNARKTVLNRLLAIPNINPTERTRLRNVVTALYADGIVSPDFYDDYIRARGIKEVAFVENNNIVKRNAAMLRTPRMAYARIDSLFNSPEARRAITDFQLANMLQPNIVVDTTATERLYEDRLRPIEAAIGVVQQGERIIDRGDIVTPQLYEILSTYEQMLESRSYTSTSKNIYVGLGQIFFIVSLLASLLLYLWIYRRKDYLSIKRLGSILLAITMLYICATIVAPIINSGIYLIPFAILPIMMVVFFDSRTAFMCHVVEILLCAPLAVFPIEFIIIQILAGLVAIFSLQELSRRSQLLRTALFVFITYAVSYLSMELLQTGTLSATTGKLMGFFAINSVLISFAYILIFVFEKMFSLTSMVTLVELSDINNPLLRDLSEQCPGTFQHSMSVSSLASDAARKIGANPLTVRAGALYHDIGKLANPAFFTENQHGINPHDALTPAQSASIIISHVTEGLKMADKAKLPSILSDMISQHHGKGLVKYFYTMEQRRNPGKEIDPAPFTYPGPNPNTREASLLMMADSVEAASRSLPEHSIEALTDLVNKIIDSQVNQGLHSESPLSFLDIKVIKEAFIARLRTMYHVRIAYPKEIDNKPSQA